MLIPLPYFPHTLQELAAVLEQQQKDDNEREAIYNAEAMHDKLEDIAWTDDVPWEETLAVTSDAPTDVANIDDDLERELSFYNQAISAAQQAVRKFEASGVQWRRPHDYYAEMVKSDEHMAKVKEQLLFETKQIEDSQQRRKERESKKFAKQVQAESRKEKDAEKKAAITSVSRLRKQREASGFADDVDMDAEIEKMGQFSYSNKGGGGDNRRNSSGGKSKPGERFQSGQDKGRKRSAKDAKFGFGGRKRLNKQNNASSAADVDGYKPSRFDDGVARKVGAKFSGGKGGGGSGGKKPGGQFKQRPGKARRQGMNNRRE